MQSFFNVTDLMFLKLFVILILLILFSILSLLTIDCYYKRFHNYVTKAFDLRMW